MSAASSTTDHDTIRQWVESRGGCPAHVKGSGTRTHPGILRIDYPGFSGKGSLEKISWKQFFDAFESNGLAFLYQDRRGSRFSKLIHRNGGSNGHTARARRKGSARGRRPSAARQSMDALKLLEQQHREVEKLFREMKPTRTLPQKRRVLRELAKALAAHTKLEETLFYPAVFAEATEEILRESVEEHLVAKRLLADLIKMEPGDAQFMGKVSVLEEAVRHHVEEEEQELFPRVRDEAREDLEVLGARLLERHRELMKDEPQRELSRETRSAVALF